MNQNGKHPQGMQGYGQPNTYFPNAQFRQNGINAQGYPPVQQGQMQNSPDVYQPSGMAGFTASSFQQHSAYTTPQIPFAQGTGSNNGYGQQPQQPVQQPYGTVMPGQNMPFSTPGGYSAPAPNGNGGSFIPQTPYSPGYTSPGYQPPQQPGYQQAGYQPVYQPAGYQQPGYSPYGQMGRTAQQPGFEPVEFDPSIPLNGGGYVPLKVPLRRKPFALKDWHLIAMGAILIALFVTAVIVTNNMPLKISLILLAAGTAGFLWIKPMVAENKRLTYSILALALCVLTAVSFMLKPQNDITNKTNGGQTAANSNPGVQEIPAENRTAAQKVQTEVTPTPEVKDNSLMERLVAFFKYWSENRQDEMLSLCAPSWQSKQENPRTSLFSLLANRRPTDCTPENITGTDADNSRRVTLTSTIDRNNTKKAEKFRMTILMLKENNEWYIDPQSLLSYETVETPDPNITPAPSPTPTAAIYPDTVLYYNPKGGEYYHFDPYCKNCSPKITPLQGQFRYSEVNDDPYNKLKPCNVCGAPLREQ